MLVPWVVRRGGRPSPPGRAGSPVERPLGEALSSVAESPPILPDLQTRLQSPRPHSRSQARLPPIKPFLEKRGPGPPYS